MQSIGGHDVSVIAMSAVVQLSRVTDVVDQSAGCRYHRPQRAHAICWHHSSCLRRSQLQARWVDAVIGSIVSAWHSGRRSLLDGPTAGRGRRLSVFTSDDQLRLSISLHTATWPSEPWSRDDK